MKHLLIFLFVLGCAGVIGHFVFADQVERVSINDLGSQSNDDSNYARITQDGRYVVFASTATNLIAGDTNTSDIFVFDRNTEEIERVSVHTDGTPGNGASIDPSISSDGRYVAFSSSATNLVSGDTGGFSDVFVHDRETGVTERVSVHTDGTPANGNAFSNLEISADGVYVTFGSVADNLVDDDLNTVADVFVHNRETGVTERVSVDSNEVEGGFVSLEPSISSDGRYVSFSSQSQLHVDDVNVIQDIFVRDRSLGTTELVSKKNSDDPDNVSYNSSISATGRYVAFASDATNLVDNDIEGQSDIFVKDRNTGVIERVSVNNASEGGDGISSEAYISADGRYVAFASDATNLVTGDTNGVSDIFVYDRNTDTVEHVSKNSSGVIGNNTSLTPSLNSDGRYVAHLSSATNLVSGDTNSKQDAFVYDREYEEVENVSSGSGASSGLVQPHISLQNYATQTSSQIVNLVAHIPATTTFYEISNTPDFTNRQIFIRDGLEKTLPWDICSNLKTCGPGQKKIYARFYNPERMISEQVLEIDYLLARECPHFKQYLRMGSKKNNPEEVTKMQAFLNTYMGENLSVDGYFGKSTYEAVKRFQEKHSDQIIKPWPALDHSTGWWYITTSGYANVLVGC